MVVFRTMDQLEQNKQQIQDDLTNEIQSAVVSYEPPTIDVIAQNLRMTVLSIDERSIIARNKLRRHMQAKLDNIKDSIHAELKKYVHALLEHEILNKYKEIDEAELAIFSDLRAKAGSVQGAKNTQLNTTRKRRRDDIRAQYSQWFPEDPIDLALSKVSIR